MTVYRKWFCNCRNTTKELSYDQNPDEESLGEPFCPQCGATPSSDPKQTVFFRDAESHDD